MNKLVVFRAEYREYVEECHNAGEIPVGFKVWFETAYYYDMRDLMPTGEQYTGFRSVVPSISLN